MPRRAARVAGRLHPLFSSSSIRYPIYNDVQPRLPTTRSRLQPSKSNIKPPLQIKHPTGSLNRHSTSKLKSKTCHIHHGGHTIISGLCIYPYLTLRGRSISRNKYVKIDRSCQNRHVQMRVKRGCSTHFSTQVRIHPGTFSILFLLVVFALRL